MKKFRFYVIFLFLFVSLVGCAETKILEQIGLTTLVGYDQGDEEKLSVTAVVRQVNPEAQSNVVIFTNEDATSKGTNIKATRQSSKKLVNGQMRVVLFGDELAKNGVHHLTDTLLQNPDVSNSLYTAVVEGQTKSLLEFQYENIEDIGQHIFKLLEQNIQEELTVSSTLHEVSHDYHSLGRDMAMPILKRDDQLIEINGVALFKEGEMVGNLSIADGFYLKLVRDKYDSGMIETILKGDDIPPSLKKNKSDEIPLVFDTIRSEKDFKLIDKTTPEFDLHLTLKARLLEIRTDINVGDPKTVAELEKAISKNLSNELSRVIAYCQEVGSDIFGFGEYYRSAVRNSKLTQEKWDELYKDAKVNINIDFTILRNGVFE